MERLFVQLSGEHDTLPRAELEAILQAEQIPYKIDRQDECILLIRTHESACELISRRAALTLACHRYIGDAIPKQDKIERLVSESDWTHLVKRSFVVRVRRFRAAHRNLSIAALERRLGEIVYEGLRRRAQVNLTRPDVTIQGIVTHSRFYVGETAGVVPRGAYDRRRPRTRPFFKPGVLSPRIARTFVNLARTKSDDIFLDPFAGTGGFLVEACHVCRYAVGSELDRIMIGGARRNLQSYGFSNWDLIRADVYYPPIRHAQTIATDPPYGIATSTKHRQTRAIVKALLEKARAILPTGHFVAFAVPSTLEIGSLLDGAGFNEVEQHSMRVHKSLTRVIYVAQKGRG